MKLIFILCKLFNTEKTRIINKVCSFIFRFPRNLDTFIFYHLQILNFFLSNFVIRTFCWLQFFKRHIFFWWIFVLIWNDSVLQWVKFDQFDISHMSEAYFTAILLFSSISFPAIFDFVLCIWFVSLQIWGDLQQTYVFVAKN